MPQKAEIEIELVLPDVTDPKDACVDRLCNALEAKKGIDRAHIKTSDGSDEKHFCIHFDPARISLGEVRQIAKQSGLELAQRYGHLLLNTNSMDARRARRVRRQIEAMNGVLDAGVAADGVIRVEYDNLLTHPSDILKGIESTGVELERAGKNPDAQHVHGKQVEGTHAHAEENSKAHEHTKEDGKGHDHAHGGIFGKNSELIFATICGATLLTGWLISVATAAPSWIPWVFFVCAYWFGGFYIVREAIEKILLRRFEIDFLMIVAALGAAALGAWAEGALLLFLFAIGHALENYAMGRARQAIEALADLAPETATVRRDGVTTIVGVEELAVGEIVIIKPNERIPADGFVVKGTSSVNQAPITGESVPVDKQPVTDASVSAQNKNLIPPENRVFAGTINGSGALEAQVTQLASDSTLARVVTMVSEAETQQSPTQQFTDKFERYFVPSVIVGVVILLFAFLVIDEPFSKSFYRAMAVLVAASPCALAIATPSAVLSGIARGARGGVLIKGGGPLENLGHLTAIAFDKTGTLTEGKPNITDVVSYGDATDEELLTNAIAVERLSDHPLAAAVVRDGLQRLKPVSTAQQKDPSSKESAAELSASDITSITGRGVMAMVAGQTVFIGKDDLFSEVDGPGLPDGLRSTVEDLEREGRTTMIVRRGERYLGVIGLMDTPREVATTVVRQLRKMGIVRMIMISGDNQNVANAVAEEVGIDEAWGDLMPEDKVVAIKKLRDEGDVAMVGDGVNDAPAMANATVGIAMGAAGSDVALETADVALMSDNLGHLPFAVGLSRQTSRIIRQNLWYSLGMVAILVPATIFGLAIGFAVLLHEGSTVVVVFNALRLLIYEPADQSLTSAPVTL